MGDSHMRVWVVAFAHLDELTSYMSLAKYAKVSKSHCYRIIHWGIKTLKDLQVNAVIINDTNGFTLSIGKANSEIYPATQKPIDKNNDAITEIISHLNLRTNRNYNPKAKEAIRLINARFNEGYKIEDFFKVIDMKSEKWMKTNMEDYLRPITLFGTKFNSYLNERPQHEQTTQQSSIARNIAIANKVASELSDMGKE